MMKNTERLHLRCCQGGHRVIITSVIPSNTVRVTLWLCPSNLTFHIPHHIQTSSHLLLAIGTIEASGVIQLLHLGEKKTSTQKTSLF